MTTVTTNTASRSAAAGGRIPVRRLAVALPALLLIAAVASQLALHRDAAPRRAPIQHATPITVARPRITAPLRPTRPFPRSSRGRVITAPSPHLRHGPGPPSRCTRRPRWFRPARTSPAPATRRRITSRGRSRGRTTTTSSCSSNRAR